MSKEFQHIPVLLKETIEGLNIHENGIYVDGTLGGAGHSIEILKKLNHTGTLIGIDRDEEALQAAKKRLADYENVIYVKGNHDEMDTILDHLQIDQVDGILLDLGISSYQIDEKSRGFSYLGEAKLDMRMDQTQVLSARDVVNDYTEEQLIDILRRYGEEKFAKLIARHICAYRKQQPIETTKELVDIIERSVPAYVRNKEGHPAKKTFQAIRIAVNNELDPLYQTIISCIHHLKSGGRLCVITFHSLED